MADRNPPHQQWAGETAQQQSRRQKRMSALSVSAIVFACISGVALAVMFAKRFLPEHHLSADSRDVVKMGMGTIATLAALVLGLLIATAKGTYDTQNGAIQELSAKAILLDGILAKYGPQTKEARDLLRDAAKAMLDHLRPEQRGGPANP